MGTRIHAIIDNRVESYRDHTTTVTRLQPSVPAALAVEDYWQSVDPSESKTTVESWIPQKEHTFVEYVDYLGPSSLLLHFSKQVAVVAAGGRWRGFLTIEPLRSIHLSAFRNIARCIGGTRMILIPDASEVGYDALRCDLSQEECIIRLRKDYGPPQGSIGAITPEVIAKAADGVPLVWFVETL